MTTTVVFGSTTDAHLASTSTNYATAAAGGGSISLVTGSGLTIGQSLSGSNYTVYQAFLEFVYSKPANSRAVAGYFKLLASTVSGTGVARSMELQTYDWGGTVSAADFRSAAALRTLKADQQAAQAAAGLAGTGITAEVANAQNANAGLAIRAGITVTTFVDASATLRVVAGSSRHRLEQTPSGQEFNAIYSSDNAGTSQDPALYVATTTNHSIDRCMGAQVQLSDGSYVYMVMDTVTTLGSDAFKIFRRTSSGTVTQLYAQTQQADPQRGSQCNTLTRDASDNIYIIGQSAADGWIYFRALVKGSGSTWTPAAGYAEPTLGYDGTINNVAAAWHPQGGTRGTLVVLVGRVSGANFQANQTSWILLNCDYIIAGTGEAVRQYGNADGTLIRATSVDGFNNFVNETGGMVDIVQASPGSAKGYIQSVARHHALGTNNGPVLTQYTLSNAGSSFTSISTAEETVSGFCTKDADAKLRTIPLSDTQFVTVTASATSNIGITVKHRQIGGIAAGFNVLSDVRLGAAGLTTMPSPATLATSSAWDAVWNPADNKLWVYYFDVANGRRLMRTDVDLNTGLAGHTEYEVNATVGATGSTNLAIRTHRGRTISDRVMITVANRTSGGTYSHLTIDDPINAAPTQPTLTPKENFDGNDEATFFWTFNDPNINSGDSQTARRLQIDNATTEATAFDTGKVVTGVTNYTLAASALPNEVDWRWRVMTWDESDAASPWSEYDFFTTSASGVVNITTPSIDNDPNVITANFSVVWNVTGTVQAAYKVRVVRTDNSSVLVDTGWVTSTATTYLIIGMLGDVEYRVEVTVRNAALVESNTATRLITPDYNSPEVPVVTFDVQNDLGYVGLSITNPTPVGDRPNPTVNQIQRRERNSATPNAPFQIIGEAEPNGTFNDYTAASGVLYDYRIRAIAGEFFTDSTITTLETALTLQGVWIHDPADAGFTVRQFLYGKDNRSTAVNTKGATQIYAGRKFPVVEFGEHQEDDFSISVDVPHGPTYRTELGDLTDFMEAKTTLVLRDNRGRVAYGTMSGYNEADQAWGSTVGFKFSRVSFVLEEV